MLGQGRGAAWGEGRVVRLRRGDVGEDSRADRRLRGADCTSHICAVCDVRRVGGVLAYDAGSLTKSGDTAQLSLIQISSRVVSPIIPCGTPT